MCFLRKKKECFYCFFFNTEQFVCLFNGLMNEQPKASREWTHVIKVSLINIFSSIDMFPAGRRSFFHKCLRKDEERQGGNEGMEGKVNFWKKQQLYLTL